MGKFSAAAWIGVYMACSSLMLIINKLAIYLLKVPSTILFCQLISSALVVKFGSMLKMIEIDEIKFDHLKPFSIVAAAFLGTIFANIKTLQYANVETFIIFRACTPLALCVLDYIFLGRQLPGQRSVLCLMGMAAGALGYVKSDDSFEAKGYLWVSIWFIVFLFDMIFLKHAADNIQVKSNWTRVFYSNFLPCVPLAAIGLFDKENEKVEWSLPGALILLVSCAMGCAMSYVSWMARSLITSTAFSIVGNSCKFITIIINCLIWENHASPTGLACLSVCLVSAFFYEQAPPRVASPSQKGPSPSAVALTPVPEQDNAGEES
mmetsp:Transcript_37047/g.62361  ORF Transcript_37047/g.62361 Transcript_37047/m.62361 type:complete len:321 (+) Transcript_37047:84-1046(+)